MTTAGDRVPRTPSSGSSRSLAVWVEDGLILASVAALVLCAFRVPLGLDDRSCAALLGATLATMAVVAVLRVRRLMRARGARAEGLRGTRKDGNHAD